MSSDKSEERALMTLSIENNFNGPNLFGNTL